MDIYKQFDAATANLSAYAVIKDGKAIGRIVFKYPRDGMGRQWCYMQVWGAAMVRGYASGCGYDKHSASAAGAASKLNDDGRDPDCNAHLTAWRNAIKDDGQGWDRNLRAAGYEVQAIL